MIDQATRLRGLMESRLSLHGAHGVVADPDVAVATARVIAVTSGKGGVGKSNISLNLAIALSRADARVCLIDANPGLSNIDLLCGLNGYWNLSHVVSGARALSEIILDGPEGIHVVSGAGGLAQLRDCPLEVRRDVLRQTAQLDEQHDYLVIDTGTGVQDSPRTLAAAADVALVVTTAEPTSIADAYATVKGLSAAPPPNLMVVANQVESARQAAAIIDRMRRTAGLFLHTEITHAGHIPHDRSVVQSVARRIPLLVGTPRSAAAQAIVQLARRVKSAADGSPPLGGYFPRIADRPRPPVTVP
jgi:flagellar biosynthesis protein FlhG